MSELKTLHYKSNDIEFLYQIKEHIIKLLKDENKQYDIALVGHTNDSIIKLFKDIKESMNNDISYHNANSFNMNSRNTLVYCNSLCQVPIRGRSINQLILFDFNRWTKESRDELYKFSYPVIILRPNNSTLIIKVR